jgi:TrmH family RNA methyltransferase
MFCTQEFLDSNKTTIENKKVFYDLAEIEELAKSGTLQSNNAAIAVAKMKENNLIIAENNEIVLVLDEIRDPGNLGTIIRIADWYGIKKIVCSETTVELYNPKVIAASMGSFTRISFFRTDLENYLGQQPKETQILGAFLDGKNIQNEKFTSGGYIVMGSESHGISTLLEQFITQKVTIPSYGSAESLNVGVATAVILDNLLRAK